MRPVTAWTPAPRCHHGSGALSYAHNMDLLTAALITLAAARITRAVTVDDVGAPIRDALLRVGQAIDKRQATDGLQRPLWLMRMDTLGTCPYCIGFWISLGTVAFWLVLPDRWAFWLLAPWAVSYLVGLAEALTELGWSLAGHFDHHAHDDED